MTFWARPDLSLIHIYFDYLNMPEKEDDTLTITVTTDAAEKDGIVFQSTDYGATWKYKGLVQIAN